MYDSLKRKFPTFSRISYILYPLQNKRKLPKVNRGLYGELLENEEAENLKENVDGIDAKKTSKKKRGLTIDNLKDERFKRIIENEVYKLFTRNHIHFLMLSNHSTPLHSTLYLEKKKSSARSQLQLFDVFWFSYRTLKLMKIPMSIGHCILCLP